jgi:hypothetical protein
LSTISPTTTIISAILIVVVLIIAFNLRGKIKRNESGNEFLPWERAERMKGLDDMVDEYESNDDEDGKEEAGGEDEVDEEEDG